MGSGDGKGNGRTMAGKLDRDAVTVGGKNRCGRVPGVFRGREVGKGCQPRTESEDHRVSDSTVVE